MSFAFFSPAVRITAVATATTTSEIKKSKQKCCGFTFLYVLESYLENSLEEGIYHIHMH